MTAQRQRQRRVDRAPPQSGSGAATFNINAATPHVKLHLACFIISHKRSAHSLSNGRGQQLNFLPNLFFFYFSTENSLSDTGALRHTTASQYTAALRTRYSV